MNKFKVITIRKMLVEDLPEVLRIEHTRDDLPWPEDTFRGCIEVGYECIVVEKNKHLIAYAIMAFRGLEAHVFNICIIPQEQRQGYGRYIMQHLLAKARARKSSKVLLKVRESKKGPYTLYTQLGFRQIDRLPDYYDVPEGKDTALVLELKLNIKKR